jgi:hypothetical protein
MEIEFNETSYKIYVMWQISKILRGKQEIKNNENLEDKKS